MEAATLYLDFRCKGCDEYIASFSFWCDFYGAHSTVRSLDDDPVEVFNIIKALRTDGHEIEYLPLLVIDDGGKLYTYTGILTETETEHIFNNHGT